MDSEHPSDRETIEARYANYLAVGTGALEILLEFGQYYSGGKPAVHTRLVTNPASALDFLGLLQVSLQQYEATFGPIRKADTDE
jgi:hypothetical protein